MTQFLLQGLRACRFLPAQRMSSSHRRKTDYALPSWLMSFAKYWKGLRRIPDSAGAIHWRFFSCPESLGITKSVGQSISTRSAEPAWIPGKNIGTKLWKTVGNRWKAKQAPPSVLKSKVAISAGGFTKRSNRTAIGHSHTVIRFSSSGPGLEAKGRGDLSATGCCMRTATTFTWRSS